MTELPKNLLANPSLDRWLLVDEHGVCVRSGKVELGQGISTAMAVIAASELRIDPNQIRMGQVDTRTAPNEGYTAGSFSIEQGGPALRVAAAITRELFAEAAAARLGAKPDEIVVENGLFRLPGRNETFSYGDLAEAVDLRVDVRQRPFPKLLGLSESADGLLRPDLPAKLKGAAYIHDIRLPGMLFGHVLRPAAPNLRLVSFDKAKVESMPGVVAVVQLGAFAGVLAKRDEQALAAVEAARRSAKWETTHTMPEDDDAQSWMDAIAVEPHLVAVAEGAAPSGRRTSARYSRPYLLHAPIGPSCAIAEWSEGRLTVYSHSQGIYPLQVQLARVLGIDLSEITVIHAHGAGCYGHNGADDVALDAALLAREVNAPVMVMWSRADEMTWSPHAAAMRVELQATQDESGRIIDWSCRVESTPHLARPGMGTAANLLAAAEIGSPAAVEEVIGSPSVPATNFKVADRGGDRNARPIYALPRLTILHHELPQGPLRSSAMRALGAHLNVFAIENFLDELAAGYGIDPLEFRLRHLEDPRAIGVLKAAAEMADWDPREAGGEGIGRGIGMARYKNSGAYYACIARVQIDEDVRLLSVHGAVDAGHVIHPDGLRNQIEGGVIQAASWTLKERAGWTEEGFTVQSWDDYPIFGFGDVPQIETAIIRSTEPSLGAGEAAAGPVAAAIGNAVAHALGVRIRQMPITRDRIMAAMMGE